MSCPIVRLSAERVGRVTVLSWRKYKLSMPWARGRYGYPTGAPFNVAVDVLGDLGEYAVAEHLGVEVKPPLWTEPRYDGDLANGDEVRTTPYPRGHLLINPSDADDCRFWLVIADPPDFMIVGWIYGRDGKRDSYRRTPRSGAYMVPQSALCKEIY